MQYFDLNLNLGKHKNNPRLIWKSKEIDLGNPSQVKRLKKLYISHYNGLSDSTQINEQSVCQKWNMYIYISYIDKHGVAHYIKPSNDIKVQTYENGYFGRLLHTEIYSNKNGVTELDLNINAKVFTIHIYEQACNYNEVLRRSTYSPQYKPAPGDIGYIDEIEHLPDTKPEVKHRRLIDVFPLEYHADGTIDNYKQQITPGYNGIPGGFYIDDMEITYKSKSIK